MIGAYASEAATSMAVVAALGRLPGASRLNLASRFAINAVASTAAGVAGGAAGSKAGEVVSEKTGFTDNRGKRGAPGRAENALSFVGGFLGSTVGGVAGSALGTAALPIGGGFAGFVAGETLGGTAGTEIGATIGRFLDVNYKKEMAVLYDRHLKGTALGSIV